MLLYLPERLGHGNSSCVAEREGFEPPIRFPVFQFSRLAPSTARPSLRNYLSFTTVRNSCNSTASGASLFSIGCKRTQRMYIGFKTDCSNRSHIPRRIKGVYQVAVVPVRITLREPLLPSAKLGTGVAASSPTNLGCVRNPGAATSGCKEGLVLFYCSLTCASVLWCKLQLKPPLSTRRRRHEV